MAKKTAKKKPVESEPPDEEDLSDDAPVAEPPPPPPGYVSVPARASCLTFVVLFIGSAVVVTYHLLSEDHTPHKWLWYLGLATLLFVTPIVVYRAVALWMFEEHSRYPDISRAWRAGIAELARNGMSLSSAPLFLVIGTGDDRLRRSFMNAAGGDFFIDGVCEDSSPLYWYANEDGIFLYLNDITWMNAAITLYELHAAAIKTGQLLPNELPRGGAGPRKLSRALYTLRPGQFSPIPAPGRGGGLPTDQAAPAGPSAGSEAAKAGEPPPKAARHYTGTLTPEQVATPAPATGPNANAPIMGARSTAVVSKHASNRLTSQESAEQLQRLEHVCGVLRRHRYPVCPINGILTLLPFQMLKAGDQDVEELERAIAADLATIYRELQLRAPVTAVIVGMDQEKGFRELIRRIGHEDAAKQRFGQRFDIRVPATSDELRRFTTHVCGTFEDWVYTLFRDEQALSHPGNTALYALLCKVRRTLKTRLGDVLGKGFGYDRQSGTVPLLFSGCYFAATGPKADRQAFVKGLLSKLYDEQEDIEWTADALREDQHRGWFAKIGWVLCGIILLATVIGYVVRNRGS
jgi:hypothetical protein